MKGRLIREFREFLDGVLDAGVDEKRHVPGAQAPMLWWHKMSGLKPGPIPEMGDSGFGAVVKWIAADILRLKDGILVEHWDVIQDEATRAQSKSKAPMFGDQFPA